MCCHKCTVIYKTGHYHVILLDEAASEQYSLYHTVTKDESRRLCTVTTIKMAQLTTSKIQFVHASNDEFYGKVLATCKF